MPPHQVGEVVILAHDHSWRLSGSLEDVDVRGAMQVHVANRGAFDPECRSHPRGEGRRELVVEPDRHAATMG